MPAAAGATHAVTPELARADAEANRREKEAEDPDPDGVDPCADLTAELARIGERYAGGARPEPLASVMQWWAWALVQPKRGAPAPGS